MTRSVTVAQRAAQTTSVLLGHPKNEQTSYLRAAALLGQARDETLDRALETLATRLARLCGVRLAAIGGKSLPG